MPNVPISGLPLTTSVCATALVPIVQNGVTCSTYACLLGSGGGGGAVTQITAGTGVTISPACGVGNVTICASGGGGGLTSVGLTMPSAFCVCGSPLTSNGSICVSACGTDAQLISGCGSIISAGSGISISGGFICSSTVLPSCGSFATCVSSPLVCGTTSVCTPTLVSTNACITGLSTSGCAVCVGAAGLLTAYTPIAGGVTQICGGSGVSISPACGTGIVTICSTASGGVSSIVQGTGICISPACGTGAVTICAIGGGVMSASFGTCSIIGNGCNNIACGSYSFSGSGLCNIANGNCSFIGGGNCNSAVCSHSFVGNGFSNNSCGDFSNVINGCNNCDKWICVCCGFLAFICCNSKFNSILNGCNNKTCGYFNNINNGDTNQICGIASPAGSCGSSKNVILNGLCGTIQGDNNVILNGFTNCIFNNQNIIGNGAQNLLCGSVSTILNGQQNQIYGGTYNTMLNGNNNGFNGCFNTVSGYQNIFFGRCYVSAFGCCLQPTADCTLYANNLCICGNTNASGIKSFVIPHPDPIKEKCGCMLKHSAIETPTAGDNIYRYKVSTCNCSATLELPDYYKFLNCDDQVLVSAKNHLGYGFGIMNEEQTSVEINTNSEGDYNVIIIGTRKDKGAIDGWKGVEV